MLYKETLCQMLSGLYECSLVPLPVDLGMVCTIRSQGQGLEPKLDHVFSKVIAAIEGQDQSYSRASPCFT